MRMLAVATLLLTGCGLGNLNPDASHYVANGDAGFLQSDGGVASTAGLAARLGQLVDTECTRAEVSANVRDQAYVEIGRLGDAEPFFQWFPGKGTDLDTRMYIASASKWVSAVTIVEELARNGRGLSTPLARKSTSATGFSFLDDVKPWAPHLERVTAEHLLAFTSGLHVKREANGALAADTWDSCAGDNKSTDTRCAVEALTQHADASVDGGTAFSYGSLHLEVAAAMVEELSGKSFPELVDQHVNTPLGLTGADRLWFPETFKTEQPTVSNSNPVPAGSIYTTTRAYRAFLKALGERTQFAAWRAVSPDVARTTGLPRLSDPSADAEKYGAGKWEYGLGHWVQGSPEIVSSAGAFGYFPWLDLKTGTWGIMGTDLGLSLSDPTSSYRCGVKLQNAVRACFEKGECAALPN